MVQLLKLTKNLRKKLKNPIGELTNFDELVDKSEIKNKIIICVGDKTCELALKNGIKVKICVYDSLIKRKKIEIPDIVKNLGASEINLKNPAGHLNPESFDVIRSALKSENNIKIIVDGEEDLIALAAIEVAPKNSIVLYGQPDEGVVMVEVDEEIKAKVGNILEQFSVI